MVLYEVDDALNDDACLTGSSAREDKGGSFVPVDGL